MSSPSEILMRLPRMVGRHLGQRLGDTKLGVHCLVIVFAMSAWADINGLWVELPLLVMEVPEQWTLPSYITVISQVANVGPLVFLALTMLMPQTNHKLEKVTSLVIIVIGVVSALLLAFLWQKTSYIGGSEHSTALFALSFTLALGDCTSSLAYYAFMSLLKPQYIASLFLGEGLSGMVPAMIALGQGAGSQRCVNVSENVNKTSNGTEYNVTTYHLQAEYVSPAFSVEVFFFTLTAILTLSGLAFVLLNILPYCQSEMVHPNSVEYSQIVRKDSPRYHSTENNSIGDCELKDDNNAEIQNSGEATSKLYLGIPNMGVSRFCTCLAILVVINMTLTSFLGTIQTYSTLPYGHQAYHLTTTLGAIANPFASFFALIIMAESLVIMSSITVVGLFGVAYIIFLAVMSPHPPLQDQDAGAVLCVGVSILVSLLLIYAKVCVIGLMRQHGRLALIWAGVATQVGSLIGALVGFFLVQANTFKAADYCAL